MSVQSELEEAEEEKASYYTREDIVKLLMDDAEISWRIAYNRIGEIF